MNNNIYLLIKEYKNAEHLGWTSHLIENGIEVRVLEGYNLSVSNAVADAMTSWKLSPIVKVKIELDKS